MACSASRSTGSRTRPASASPASSSAAPRASTGTSSSSTSGRRSDHVRAQRSVVTPGTTASRKTSVTAPPPARPDGSPQATGGGDGRTPDYPEPVSRPKKPQVMKAATAATKLDIYLPATPQEFQERLVSREELDEL